SRGPARPPGRAGGGAEAPAAAAAKVTAVPRPAPVAPAAPCDLCQRRGLVPATVGPGPPRAPLRRRGPGTGCLFSRGGPMITLVTSNVDTGAVRRRRFPSADLARRAVDALLETWYQRRQHGRGRRGRPPEGLVWDPGAKGRRHPFRFELTGGDRG